ncbi:MAG: hypothetical protein GX567_12830 [Clostridia bacterium]|nr:hypothetical protein [Clostridia bacterium]
MYQRIAAVVISFLMGIYGAFSFEHVQSGTVMAMWGFVYPHLTFIEGTYQYVNEITGEIIPYEDVIPIERILIQSPEKIKVRWKCLEGL